MEGGVEKGLKEIQGRSTTLLVLVCDSVCVCLRYFGERWYGFLPTNKISLLDPSLLSYRYALPHPLIPFSLQLTLPYSPLSFHPAGRPWCKIHHVLTLHYPQHILRQRDDESHHSPLLQVGTTTASKLVLTSSVCVMMSFPAIAY